MPTQTEVRDDLKRKLKLEMRRTLVWADVTTAFGAATAGQKDAVVDAINRADQRGLTSAVSVVIGQHIDQKAETEADARVADGNIDFNEYII